MLGCERPHDLGRTLTPASAKRLHTEWSRAAVTLAAEPGRAASGALRSINALDDLLRDTCTYCGAKHAVGKVDAHDARFYCEKCWKAYDGGGG